MLTSRHPADDDRIYYKESCSLAAMGAEVTVVCPDRKAAPCVPGELRICFRMFRHQPGVRGVIGAMRALKVAVGHQGASVVHCHEPDALVAALAGRDGRRTKIIYDSHEMWSAVAAQRFPKGAWGGIAAAFRLGERRAVARADAAVGASWAISDYLQSALPVGRVETILNVPVVSVFGEGQQRRWDEETVLCHDGHLSFDRGLVTMAEAVRIVAAKHRVVFKIVGDVFNEEREWLEGFIARHGLQKVIVRTGWLPYGEVGQALAPCHIGLIALQQLPNNVVTSSNKVFNYMLYGIPFVAPGFRLSKVKLVREERCGVLADSSDPAAYASAICRMIEDRAGTEEMARRALEASRSKYRWAHMERPLLRIYQRVLNG